MKISKERGITLVALIITIIVLIILAAVTVLYIRTHDFVAVTADGATKYKYQTYVETLEVIRRWNMAFKITR